MICQSPHLVRIQGRFQFHGDARPMTQDQVSLNLINLFKDLQEPDPVNDTAGTADGNNNSLQLTPCTSVLTVLDFLASHGCTFRKAEAVKRIHAIVKLEVVREGSSFKKNPHNYELSRIYAGQSSHKMLCLYKATL
jgi:hypothetical protein